MWRWFCKAHDISYFGILYWLRYYSLYNTNLFLYFHYKSLITTAIPHSTYSILEISCCFKIYFRIIRSSTFLSLPIKCCNKYFEWFFVCSKTSVSFVHLILIYLITVTSCKCIDSIIFSPGFPVCIKPFLLKYFSPNFLLEHSLYLFFPYRDIFTITLKCRCCGSNFLET